MRLVSWRVSSAFVAVAFFAAAQLRAAQPADGPQSGRDYHSLSNPVRWCWIRAIFPSAGYGC